MGAPEEYDWGITPEAFKAAMVVSVAVSLDRSTLDEIKELGE
jgi:hypothetical protein